MLRKLVPKLQDIFVTLYSEGDFLTEHNDFYSGTWAVVLSLVWYAP